MRIPDSTSEARLEALREEAQQAVRAKQPRRRELVSRDYADRPYLKPPVWTWEVPCYFFLGGLAGACSLLGCFAFLQGQMAFAEKAFASAFLGASVSPVLLASDLGRPLRALNMFRVFKWRSPMSVGSWGLFFFGGATALTWLLAWLWSFPSTGAGFWLVLSSSAVSGLLGLLLMTYTGVLLGITVVPYWVEHRRQLPLVMGLTALGSGAAWLEWLSGGFVPATRLLLVVALAESLLWLRHLFLEKPAPGVWPRRLLVVGGFLTGPTALCLAIFPSLRPIACGGFLTGALLLRFGWIHAGKASALEARPK